MKKLILLLTFFSAVFSYSQNTNTIQAQGSILNKDDFLHGGVIHNPPNDLVGSPYLFEKWDNNNFIHLSNNYNDENVVRIKNININYQLDKIASKIDEKHIFSFNSDYFDYVIINNRRFEYFDYPIVNNKKLFEIIGSINDAKLLKSYSFYIIRGEVQGYQTSRPVDKLKMKSNYFIKNGNHISEFTLKKKTILALMGDAKSKVSKFAKENKLSFKKDKDLVKILHFYNSL